jgi:hypothetical protein
VVIERRYHCKDYRSEFASAYAHQLYPPTPEAHRLHFFASRVERSTVTMLSNEKYLGYVVCRPPTLPLVGRTMLVPPPNLRKSIRAWATETVHLFGQPLKISASPFMQQDSKVDVCAHVCAWMLHFTMFLREREFSRRLIAEFPISSGKFSNPARPVQGDGLDSRQIERLLASFDLPTQAVDCDYGAGLEPLPYPWGPERPWEISKNKTSRAALTRRGIGETACRYLNSGYPLYVSVPGHSMIVNGYRATEGDEYHNQYIGHDDTKGPYVILPDPRATKLSDQWTSMVCPLPEHIALPLVAAERLSLAVFKDAAGRLELSINEGESSGRTLPPEVEPLKETFKLMTSGALKRRTYVVLANEWKRDLRQRCNDQSLIATYAELPMSRHIAVTEFLEVRGQNELVRGEVIIDATCTENNPSILATRVGAFVTTNIDAQFCEVNVSSGDQSSGARGGDPWKI